MELTVQGDDIVMQELAEYSARCLRALVRAMNRALASGRSVGVKGVSAEVGLQQKVVRDAMTFREATFQTLTARLGLSLKKIPLSKFNARGPEPSKGKGRGVSWRIGSVSKRGEDMFLATLRSGHRGVFSRVVNPSERKSLGAWSKNLPIFQHHGPSLGYILDKQRQPVQKAMIESFHKNFDHEMEYQRGRTGFQMTESGGDV